MEQPKVRFSNGRIRCWICDKTGHLSRDCWRNEQRRVPSPMMRKRDHCASRECKHCWRIERKALVKPDDDYRVPIRTRNLSGKCEKASTEDNSPDKLNLTGQEVVVKRLMKVLPKYEWTDETLRSEQLLDLDLSIIMKYKEREEQPTWNEIADKSPVVKAYFSELVSLRLENGCLKRIWESSDGTVKHSLKVVPKSRIAQILKKYHEGTSRGHLGINKTLREICQRFYWSECRQSVAEWCGKCNQCGRVKGPARK